MKKIYLYIIIFSLSSFCFAAPSITGTSGTYTHGSSITITGSGFTSHANYNNISDTWEGESFLNFRFNDFEQVNISQHGFAPGTNPAMSQLTTSSKHAGNQAGHFQDQQGNIDDTRVWYQAINSGSGNTWYVSFWIRTNASDKFLRYYWNAESTANNYYIAANSNYDDGCTGSASPWIGAGGSTWTRVENIIVWSDSTHYTSTIIESGEALQTGRTWCSTSARNADGRSIDIPNDTSYSSDSDYIEIDDIYIDYTQARVEICDSNTWSGRSHCEVQPPSAWATGEITASLNIGSFASDATVYLYVVDSTNTANTNGYEITLGGGEEPPASTAPISGVKSSGVKFNL